MGVRSLGLAVVAGVGGYVAGRARSGRTTRTADESRQFVARVLAAEDGARRTIAQALHDDTLQTLLAAHQELLDAAPGRAGVTRAHEAVAAAIDRLREEIVALHPVTLEQGGLEQALQAVAHLAERQGGFACDLRLEPDALGQHDDLVLSAARELLSNAAKHSGAARVNVELRREDSSVVLTVSDDGAGIPAGRREEAIRYGHIGLASLSERLEEAGGQLDVDGSPGGGTIARARLPGR